MRPALETSGLYDRPTCPTYRIYGIALQSDYPLTGLPLTTGKPDVTFTCTADSPLTAASAPGLVTNLPSEEEGAASFVICPLDDGEMLHFAGLADYYLWPDRIVCHLLDPVQRHLVEILLLGVVLAYWLERRGMPPLHASAVAVGEHAIAFAANHMSGKTSLAAAFLQAGYDLLTDDTLPLRTRNGALMAQPGYPRMRMWPEQAARFELDPETLPKVLPESTKRHVPVADLGTFCQQPKRLVAIYLPERYDPDELAEPEICIEPLSQAEAVFTLVEQVFVRYLINSIEHQQQRLQLFAPHVPHLSLRRLTYPSGFEYLPRVCDAILADVAALTSG